MVCDDCKYKVIRLTDKLHHQKEADLLYLIKDWKCPQ